MVGLFVLYKYGRTLSEVDVSVAYANANTIWELERWFRLPSELSAQHAILAAHGFVEFANTYYAVVHFPATIACFVWMYIRRPALYPAMRRAMIGITAIALVCHLVYPLAPPRMLANLGFIDTGAIYGPNVYPQAPSSDGLVNQYAAMPSLHVGWAVLVAAGLIAATTSRWRWLWLLHPTITVLAVVATANHFWLDGIAACVMLGLVTLVLSRVPWAKEKLRRLLRLRGGAPAGGESPAPVGADAPQGAPADLPPAAPDRQAAPADVPAVGPSIVLGAPGRPGGSAPAPVGVPTAHAAPQPAGSQRRA